MQCKNILKLASVCAAMLVLVFTLEGIAREEEKPDPLVDTVAGMEMPETDTPTEREPEEIPGACIRTGQEEESPEVEPAVILEVADEEILMKVAMAEAEGESTKGKALVILTVLNRMESDDFPDTVAEVVFQDNQYSPVSDGRYETAMPDDDCVAALGLVESGWDESMGAMYFENAGRDSWHSRNLEFLFQEGNHRFYR